MARYKHIDTNPRFLAVDLQRQLLPGTFEYALNYLLDHKLDLSHFDARFNNDTTGATAYPPAMLLKVILFAYSQGIVSSRGMERACCEHVTFIALTGDTRPHFTTLAAFVSALGNDIAQLFSQILFICDKQGLIGREMFAIDGVKLPSNASKGKSGTRSDFKRQADKLEGAARTMLQRHREADQRALEPDLQAKEMQRINRLQADAEQLRQWLVDNPEDRKGSTGKPRKSNLTDNDSAKMATSKGVIQGYTGVAAVDARHQIIVEAQAHGTGSEQELLIPVVEALQEIMAADTLITTDAGYHSESNLKKLHTMKVNALIADNKMRSRDKRFAEQNKYKALPDPLHDKGGKPKQAARYQPKDFDYDADKGTCFCPAGKQLYSDGSNCLINGYLAVRFKGALRDCGTCILRDKCLQKPDTARVRQVSFLKGKAAGESFTDKMKKRIDTPEGRAKYGRRFATVEPVFGNIRYNKRLDRFTLRGRTKVDAQWKLFCLVHNIEKLAHYGNVM